MSHFQPFKEDVSGIALPDAFTFPFYYEPHPLAEIAAAELQHYLENQTKFEYNFGLEEGKEGLARGKMFGVLVVQNQQGELGYLAAFSGKLLGQYVPPKFVPPIYDMLAKDSFFRKGEAELNIINHQIETLEKEPRLLELKATLEARTRFVKEELQEQKAKMKRAKKARKAKREEAEKTLSPEALVALKKTLEQESHNAQFLIRELTEYRNEELERHQKALGIFTSQIAQLKDARKRKSNGLQQQIFDQYQFLNQHKQVKRLTEIFPNTDELKPPSGSGDCAAPKLLQYAFLHDLKPIAMAEFWWGISPKTEVRKHKYFYPACQGRCKPILGHMLEGIEMDENPLLKNPSENKAIDIIFEDDAILVINKPAEFLTVPGKVLYDSVYTRVRAMYPDATGPMMVHRLDMSTSGILLISKTKEVHKRLQRQFISRKVKKRYTALLDGIIEEDEGEINLPHRVDLDDRPRQMVCYEHGKNSRTKWKVVQREDGKTRIHFFPITGRTHQLRVHASHPSGLNTPIIGDDLYGKKADRLHLHAAYLEFTHPVSQERVSFSAEAEF
ncbi:MAG: RluA family pseudouridine synthase [Bacteroidia bacterium]